MKIKDHFLTAIYPNRCFVCDKLLSFQGEICENCKKKKISFNKIYGSVCDICGLKLTDCNCAPSRFYLKTTFPFFYEDDVRHSLHKLKFRGRLDKIKPFAKVMFDALVEREITDIDIITFIPMGRLSKFNRGYNQAELLCKEISSLSGIKSLPLLYKTGKNNRQHDLNMTERQGNILGIYEPDERFFEEIKSKNILIVDDIITTGATLSEAAKTLLIFGAENVYAVSAAGRPKKKKESKKPAD